MPYREKHKHVIRASELKKRNLSAGACANCGKSTPSKRSTFQLNKGERQWFCEACSKKHKEYLKKLYGQRLNDGVCVQCGARERATKTMCQSCRDASRSRAKDNYQKMLLLGRCVSCRKEHNSGLTRCEDCNAKRKKRKK